MSARSFIAVYMMTNIVRGTLYVGVTSELMERVGQHRLGAIDGFTRKHGLKRLVWYEPYERMDGAIVMEKRVKRWRREWKYNLIEAKNPHWNDLFPMLMKEIGYQAPKPY